MFLRSYLACVFGLLATTVAGAATDASDLEDRAARIFEARCVTCHNDETRNGGLSLQSAAGFAAGSSNGKVIVPGASERSKLIEAVSGDDPKMPKKGAPLAAEDIDALRRWIDAGAKFSADRQLEDLYEADADWWSLKAIASPDAPAVDAGGQQWVRNPIDRFIWATLRDNDLSPSTEADRRTLIRRLYFDLLGLPPTPAQIDAFIDDETDDAYERLVDRLLASPRYGERWARHWLDLARYADTHGYDKDQLRPNAWPYRDYVIRSLNEDKPYGRFVREQIAGDVLYPGDRDGVVGPGFLAAGPWDLVGHIEVRNGTMEKKRVRNLDRDDMVAAIGNVFLSITVQCARCHNHKFDPITQNDYYAMQAVVAAVDRADRPYETDPEVAMKRVALEEQQHDLTSERAAIQKRINRRVAGEIARIDTAIAKLETAGGLKKRPEFGYHSGIVGSPNVRKWVQVDLSRSERIDRIVLHACHDDYAEIGAGFGFPVRYRVEVSDDPNFRRGATTVVDATQRDQSNPGLTPVVIDGDGVMGRYVRVTATALVEREKDFIFALAELRVLEPQTGRNLAAGKPVKALDSIEARPRWSRKNLTDGIFYRGALSQEQRAELASLRTKRSGAFEQAATGDELARLNVIETKIADTDRALKAIPNSDAKVYAATTDFKPRGSFVPTRGKPRTIYRLKRGDEKQPAIDEGPTAPGAIRALSEAHGLSHHFDLPAGASEGDRRAALARWITDVDNPLTWRSIVNRVWQHHFGRGLVDTPNDFGRMGGKPTHPELLDYLALRFLDDGQSLKSLHRLIVTSATYRQVSEGDAAKQAIDASNRLLWRQNRRKLEAEPIRDATLAVAGKLNLNMGGPGFKAFGLKRDHSPHYKYHEYNPRDEATHRRAIYRFVVRSVPDPFMSALDCADPSQIVDKRIETLTALQALTLMNNRFMIVMSEGFAKRVADTGETPTQQISAAYRLAIGRAPTADELAILEPLAAKHGMANVCRLILNSNEFIFVD